MDVMRKVSVILVFVALLSFVGGPVNAEHDAKININTATIEELTFLKGIGEKKAESIVEHRKKIGTFATIDDLKGVKGIGDKIFNKIKHLIVVE